MVRKNIKRPRLNSRRKRRARYLREEEEKRQNAILFCDMVIARAEELSATLPKADGEKQVTETE